MRLLTDADGSRGGIIAAGNQVPAPFRKGFPGTDFGDVAAAIAHAQGERACIIERQCEPGCRVVLPLHHQRLSSLRRGGRIYPGQGSETFDTVVFVRVRQHRVRPRIDRLQAAAVLAIERRFDLLELKDIVVRVVIAADDAHQVGTIALGAVSTDFEANLFAGRQTPCVGITEYLFHTVNSCFNNGSVTPVSARSPFSNAA